MPTIRLQWLNTRTERERRALAKGFTKVMVDVVGVPKDIVNVIFDEVDPRMHAKGGVFFSDLMKKAPAKRKTRRAPAKRAAAKKAPAKRAAARKAPAKRAAAKKAPAKRSTTRRAPARKKTTRRSSATRKR
ncbi:MAG: tautomerase family protein [Rhodospirillales bacterium]|jgi:phenylpyruvate tautomerase PptA (4-oxalocrotonate tautomerase family)|nr:tautomerase family protein [Rhodospirillales bacterium]